MLALTPWGLNHIILNWLRIIYLDHDDYILQVFCHLFCEMYDHRACTEEELLGASILLLNLEMALSHLKITTIIMINNNVLPS